MNSKRCRLVLSVLFVAALLMAPAYCAEEGEDDEYADDEKALLIARKSITSSDVVLGGNLTVVIEIYNAGTSSAFAVEVTDASDVRLEVIGGSLRARFEKVAPGATVRHTYFVKPLVSGIVVAQPATVKYKPDSPTGTDVQVARSTDVSFTVLTLTAKLTKFMLALGKYLTLGNFQTVAHWAMFSYISLGIALPVGAYFGYLSMHEGRKRAKYQRALQEVEKMK